MHPKRQTADVCRLAAVRADRARGRAPLASLGFAFEVLIGQILPVFFLFGSLPSGRLDALDASPSSLTRH